MTDLEEVVNYLNMKINITADFITVYQCEYIQSVLECFHMNECKLMIILMSLSMKLVTYQESLNTEYQTWYRSAVGSLMWSAIQCRSDIVYSVKVIS